MIRPATSAAIATMISPMGFAVRAMLKAIWATVAAAWAILTTCIIAPNAVMIAFMATTAPATAAMPAPNFTSRSLLSLTNVAMRTSTGARSLRTGSSAMPISSCVSWMVSWKILYWPAAVLAASAAAPPVSLASSLLIFAKSPDLTAASSMPGMSFARAAPLPAYAFASALDTWSVVLPVAALTSSATARPCWACVTLPVAVASFARAGRSSSSATPVASDSLVM